MKLFLQPIDNGKKAWPNWEKCGAVDTRSSERFHTSLALILLLRLNENFLFFKYNLNLLNFVIPHVARREPRIAGLRKGEARANPALSQTSVCANKNENPLPPPPPLPLKVNTFVLYF